MSSNTQNQHSVAAGMPKDKEYARLVNRRQRQGRIWAMVFQAATLVGILALTALLYNIVTESFGLVALENEVNPAALAINGVPLEELSKEQLQTILQANISAGLLRRFENDQPFAERDWESVYGLVLERVVKQRIVATWPLQESLFQRGQIEQEVAAKYPEAVLEFRSWVNPHFVTGSQSSVPILAGVRTALFGSLWVILITILFAFPVGVGAAIYLEEYAQANAINRLIQTNINNLAGVPSIIYGMLGLAIFVRVMEPVTSGSFVGITDPATANGRTILSAGLTLGLLILPMIIINAQEAIRAVSSTLRQAGYGLGATQWQVIWHHVLPSAMPGILTGTILSISRAIGETAPLVVIGASTFIAVDPNGPFSKFTVLPIQIYQWTISVNLRILTQQFGRLKGMKAPDALWMSGYSNPSIGQ